MVGRSPYACYRSRRFDRRCGMRRVVGGLRQSVAVAASTLLLVGVWVATTSSSAGAVTDEAGFTTAWETNGTTSIALDNDITLTCVSGSPFRNSPTNITVDGQGHTLTQTCADHQVMSSHGTGSVTLENITITGGHATGLASNGGALLANGDLTVVNSTITGNRADSTGGGLVANGEITISGSTLSNNQTSGN